MHIACKEAEGAKPCQTTGFGLSIECQVIDVDWFLPALLSSVHAGSGMHMKKRLCEKAGVMKHIHISQLGIPTQLCSRHAYHRTVLGITDWNTANEVFAIQAAVNWHWCRTWAIIDGVCGGGGRLKAEALGVGSLKDVGCNTTLLYLPHPCTSTKC